MLSTADQESILDDLRVDIPLRYNFHFMASHVEVITGKQEGTCAKKTLKLMKNAFVMIFNLFCVFGVPITKLSNLISYYHAPVQMQYLNLLACSYCPSAACLLLKYCSREAFLITAVKGSTQQII